MKLVSPTERFGDRSHTLTTEDRRRGAQVRWQRWRDNQDEVEREAKERAAATIAEALERGAETIAHLAIHGESEQVRFATAKDLLDRFGLKAADKLELRGADGGPPEVAQAVLDADTVAAKLAEAGLVRTRWAPLRTEAEQ